MNLFSIRVASKLDASANADAEVPLAAVAGTQYLIHGFLGGYDADPTGGVLATTGLVDDQLSIPVTSAGPLPHLLPVPVRGAMGGAVTVTLEAGGAGVTGKLSVLYSIHRTGG